MRQAVLMVVMCTFFGVLSASASSPDPAVRAEKLHLQALKHADKKQWDVALGLWEAAEALHKDWRYPFNQSEIHRLKKRYELAWHSLRRATDYNLPGKRRIGVSNRLRMLEAHLLKTHSLVEIVVEPESAIVTLNGEVWNKPYARWMSSAQSQLVVRAPEHSSYKAVWKHQKGQRNRLVIALQTDQKPGQLTISGHPVGASVSVDGKVVGKLPRVTKSQMAPGPHIVEVSHGGFLPVKREVMVQQGVQTIAEVSLLPLGQESLAPGMRENGGSNDAIIQWSIMALGAAFVGAAAGVNVAALDAADKANGYAYPRNDLTDKKRWQRYSNALDDVDTLEVTAYVLYGAGGAAVLSGIIWMLIDESDDVGMIPTLVNNEAPGVSWRVRF